MDGSGPAQGGMEGVPPEVVGEPRLACCWHECEPQSRRSVRKAAPTGGTTILSAALSSRSHIEEPYDSPLRVVLVSEESVASLVLQAATDGSARQQVGGYAAVLLVRMPTSRRP